MTTTPVLGGFFPPFVKWGWDQIAGWGAGIAGDLTGQIFESLTQWVTQAAANAMLAVWEGIQATTAPDLVGPTATWFTENIMSSSRVLGAYVILAGLIIGIMVSVLQGNPTGMAKTLIVDMPKALTMFIFLVGMTTWSLRLTDEVADWFVFQTLGDDAEQFFEGFAEVLLLTASGGQLASFMLTISALIAVIASMAVTAVLLARTAYIYVLLALSPMIAGLMLTSYRGVCRKLIETLVGVILTKLVIVVVVVIGGAAMVNAPGVGDTYRGDDYSALQQPPPEPGEEIPEEEAEALAGEQSQAVSRLIGRFMVGSVLMVLALFTPAKLMQMIPTMEGAGAQAVQRGVIGGAAASAPGMQTAKRAGMAATYAGVRKVSTARAAKKK